ncbi:O-methyltransferase [Pantoea sp. BAV 3049]|uniref:O-methyltransferase n=1 Tax=Pantoea sp. BAV 3049 TaxID=2654188 RepID=UPI00131AB2B5|nr:class I SAM-dependent methyltransferase [Pantoea sp. BAV 3049]
MNTLNTQSVSAVLSRLFSESESAWSEESDVSKYWESLPEEERQRLLRSKTDYLEFYGQMKDIPLSVSRNTGKLLYILASSSRALNIVEFGTSVGISTIHLAAALRDNGGGRLITSEFEPSKVQRARQNLADCGLADLVDVREGDALVTLSRDLPVTVDLLLLDGAKGLYPEILDLIVPRLSRGALVIEDDADFNPEYLEKIHSSEAFISVPVEDGLEISLYVGQGCLCKKAGN